MSVEWGVRCGQYDGDENAISEAEDLGHAQSVVDHHSQSCPGPHVVVSRTVTPWTEVTP